MKLVQLNLKVVSSCLFLFPTIFVLRDTIQSKQKTRILFSLRKCFKSKQGSSKFCQFHQQFMSTFFVGTHKIRSLLWQTEFGKRHSNLSSRIGQIKLRSLRHNVGEIEWRFFRQSHASANFCLAKLTPGLNFINVLRAAFAPVGLRQ
jgi:hypothetical protein